MTIEKLQEAIAALQQHCKSVSITPKLGHEGMQNLVAFRDDLAFTPTGLGSATRLMTAALAALESRFKFAKLDYETSHGPAETFAQEFAAIGVLDQTTNQPNGQIRIVSQFILKPVLTVVPPGS